MLTLDNIKEPKHPEAVLVVGSSGLDASTVAQLVRAERLARRIDVVLAGENDIEISVKALIFNQVGELLVLKDARSAWHDLPGGHLEDGEDAVQGLCREVREETRLSIGDIRPKLTTALKLGRKKRPVQFFTATALHLDVVLSDEHSEYFWVRPADLSGYNLGVFLNPALSVLKQGLVTATEPLVAADLAVPDSHHETARQAAERIYRAAVDDWLAQLNADLVSAFFGHKAMDYDGVLADVYGAAAGGWAAAMAAASRKALISTSKILTHAAGSGQQPKEDDLKSFAQLRGKAVERFPASVEEKLRASLKRGVANGEDPQALARRLSEALAEVHAGTGRRLAATEAQVTYGVAQHKALELAGFSRKRWQTVGDDRVRDSHYLCEDQGAIPASEPFHNGLMYPGDPNGDASEVINCRCNLVGEL